MKKYLLCFFLFLSVSSISYGQQMEQFTQYMFNLMSLNPGYAGANDAICATTLGRQQWMGFKDPDGESTAPQTFLLSLDAPVRILHGGLGATIYQDQLGFEKTLGIKLGYAFHLKIGSGRLQAGVRVGFIDKSIEFEKFRPIDVNDPLLVSPWQSNITMDFDFGLYYFVSQKYYFGMASSQLSETIIDNTGLGADYALKRHFNFVGGYTYTFANNPAFQILPSFLVKTDFASVQYDISALLRVNNKFWGGLNYRVQDAVSLLFGLNWKSFKFGYSYDLTTSPMGAEGRSNGSMELMIRYCFNIVILHPETEYHNTRLFDDGYVK